MIVNHTTFRTPRVLTTKEFNACKKYVEQEIIKYLKTTNSKEFIVKDIFGYDNWDWSSQHPQIQILYDKWEKHYITNYGKRWTNDEIWTESIKQAGISLGFIVKQACRDMKQYSFKISNPTHWNIVYKIV